MSQSNRETLLRVLLPSLVIGVGYGLFVAPTDETGVLKGKLRKAQSGAAASSPSRTSRQIVRVGKLTSQRDELDERLEHLLGASHDHDRMSALRDVVQAFAAHDVLVIDEFEGGGEGFKVPVDLESLGATAARLRPKKGARTPAAPARHLSQLHLRGGYLAVLHTLEELAADSDSPALVIGVDLDSTDPSGQHLWTVVVWV